MSYSGFTETDAPPTDRRNARDIASVFQRLENLRRQGNEWWRTQSWSNPSPPSNSLLTGERTGIFRFWGCFWTGDPRQSNGFEGLEPNSLLIGAGNFCKRTGSSRDQSVNFRSCVITVGTPHHSSMNQFAQACQRARCAHRRAYGVNLRADTRELSFLNFTL